jgi:predicted RND superfamily exporter protein
MPGFERYVDVVCRNSRLVILILIAVTAFWVSQLRGLRVEIDPDANLPQGHPYIRALHVLENQFGEKNLVVIGLFPHDGNVFTAPFLAKLQRITKRIGEMPGLIRSTYLGLATPLAKAIEGSDGTMLARPIMDGAPTTEADVAEVRRRAFATPLYVGTIISKDSRATAIIANFRLSSELTGYPEIEERLETILAEENDGTFTTRFGGPVAVLAALAHVTERTVMLFPLAVLVVALIHYEAFRTLQGMLLPLVTAILAVTWSLGLMGLLRIPLDPFNTTTPILILAVAAGHAVQILKRYYEEYDRHRDTTVAVRSALVRVGPVMVIAGAIAALSFLSLVVFATATIRNFGMLTGAGIVSALIIELTLIPSVRVNLRAPRATELEREARSGRVLERALGRLGGLISRRPGQLIGACALVAGVALLVATQLRVDTSFKRQFGPQHPVRIADDALNEAFGGTNTLIFIVQGPQPNALHDPNVLAAIADLQRFVESDPAVGKTISIVDYVAQMDRAMHDGRTEPAIPASEDLVGQYLFLYSMAGGPEDLDSQIDQDHRNAVVRAFVHRDSTDYGEHLISRVREHVAKTFPPGFRVDYSGIIASNAALAETMVHGKIFNMLQIAGIIMLISGLVLRSPLAGLLVAAPLAMAVLVNFGAMSLAHVPLDIMTAPLAAMAVGIGADYAIYFLFRFREELAVSSTRELALASTLRTSGKAIVYVSSAISGGYLVLCVSGFVYHRELSMMIALAMAVSSMAAITLLPALLVWVEPRFLFGERTRLAERQLSRAS